MGYSKLQKVTHPPTAAFSGNPYVPTCIDCGVGGEQLIGYTLYMVGDITCRLHGQKRLQLLGRGRINYSSYSLPPKLKLHQ
jgi:hypothetical protein